MIRVLWLVIYNAWGIIPRFIRYLLSDILITRLSIEEEIQANMIEIKGRVVIYSVIGCPYCMSAKNTLQKLNLPYSDIVLDTFPQCRHFLKDRTGKHTVPQIFFNNIYVGGCDELEKAVAGRTEIERLIAEVTVNEAPADAPQIPDPSTAAADDFGDIGDFQCEPDEYALLVQDLKGSGLIKDHKKGLKTHKNSFSGKEFVEWVIKTKQLDRAHAIEMGQALIDQHFGAQIQKNQVVFQDNETFYRLLDDDDTTALNGGMMSDCQPRPAGVLGEEIRKMILKIYSAFLTPDGKKVDYKGIAGSAEFDKYKGLTKELVRVQIESASRAEKLAFFINIYNALVIHGNIVRGPPTNLWQRYKFFNTVRYVIGGQAYSLQDIENGVLRANRRGVGMFTRPFGKSDPRLKVALDRVEPLIHFALVCGAKSCPPIKTYSTDAINSELRLAAEAFLDTDDGIMLNMSKKEIKLSMIFKWYREDFGKNNEEVVQCLYNLTAEGDKRKKLGELVSAGIFKVGHMTYDWGVNS